MRKESFSCPFPAQKSTLLVFWFIKFISLLSFWGNKRAYSADGPTATHASYDEESAASKPDFVRVIANNSEGDFKLPL